jgi:hypothetical protein
MILNIANDTKQNWVFHYRLRGDPGSMPGPFALEIPTGRQAQLNLSNDDVFYVIEQLERHGGRDANDLQRPVGKHLGLLYRVQAVVTSDEIQIGHAHVVDTQERRSATEATKAALGFDRAANQMGRGRRAAKVTQVEVEQLVDPRERRTGNEVMFRMGVDTDGTEAVPIVN